MQAYAENINTFGGTATKWAQRAVSAYAAQTSYTLFSMDMSAAFLEGHDFQRDCEGNWRHLAI
eukprot:12925670-Prorocentrum_lima.AAC.1